MVWLVHHQEVVCWTTVQKESKEAYLASKTLLFLSFQRHHKRALEAHLQRIFSFTPKGKAIKQPVINYQTGLKWNHTSLNVLPIKTPKIKHVISTYFWSSHFPTRSKCPPHRKYIILLQLFWTRDYGCVIDHHYFYPSW